MTNPKIIQAFTEASLGSFRYGTLAAKDHAPPINKKMVKKIPKDKKIYVEKLYDGTEIYIVDGKWIRDFVDVSWIGGGHNREENWIPEGEIWIESQVNPFDCVFYLAHEIVEIMNMTKSSSKKYEVSHDIANSVEHCLRTIAQVAEKNKE